MEKKALIIGSTAADVIIEIDNLPRRGDDINVSSQSLAPGGCAYNVASALDYFGKTFDLLSPVGTGYYGDFICKILSDRGFSTPLHRITGDNGCCYCLVDRTGERSFICHRGVEYQFREEFFSDIKSSDYSFIYICGLDLEDSSSDAILSFLESAHKNKGDTVTFPGYAGMHSSYPCLFFAPGPRISHMPVSILKNILNLNPVLHMNEKESAYLISKFEGINNLLKITGMPIISTKGGEGAEIYELKDGKHVIKTDIPACPVEKVVDTIGAGDAHAGGVISGLMDGLSLKDTVIQANLISSRIVQSKGATIYRKTASDKDNKNL